MTSTCCHAPLTARGTMPHRYAACSACGGPPFATANDPRALMAATASVKQRDLHDRHVYGEPVGVPAWA